MIPALLVFAYMTGWRISDMLALRREDLDLEGGYAITRAEDNKGDRDDRVRRIHSDDCRGRTNRNDRIRRRVDGYHRFGSRSDRHDCNRAGGNGNDSC